MMIIIGNLYLVHEIKRCKQLIQAITVGMVQFRVQSSRYPKLLADFILFGTKYFAQHVAILGCDTILTHRYIFACKSTWCHNSEDHHHRCENLKSYSAVLIVYRTSNLYSFVKKTRLLIPYKMTG
jgi:hypothetical protein